VIAHELSHLKCDRGVLPNNGKLARLNQQDKCRFKEVFVAQTLQAQLLEWVRCASIYAIALHYCIKIRKLCLC